MTRHYGSLLAASMIVAGLATVPRISAAEEPNRRERAEKFVYRGMESLMQALDLLIESIPQYEMPIVNENGDIIIRRRRGTGPEDLAPEKKAPDADITKT